ncbi:MAG: flagellar biosynthesis protein FlhF [Melioribacteraceae bacterium]|nr:flagellar biosynthesis protein FlhF [Melioribacteraceae bacterium]
MQIKKYLAPTLKEAISKMKDQLGEEAIVLSTRVLEGDARLGLKKMFEITAGSDENLPDNLYSKNTEPIVDDSINFDNELAKLSERIFKSKSDTTPDIFKKIDEVRKSKNLNLDLNEIKDLLIQRDVDEFNVRKILSQLERYKAFLNDENIDNYVVSTIASMIPTEKFEFSKNSRPHVISLVGPTGVGKTTCIAKLAVISKILHNLDIGLISIDTYRLGALDQLKIFSEVSDIEFLVAYDPADVKSGMEKFKKKDLVFIDTVGRSQKNITHLEEIKKFTSSVKVDETYLVLNTTVTSKTMIDVAEKFKVLNYTGLVFSKLDEAVSFGNILTVASKFNTPIKYLTNGQVIPDDIVSADPEFIANLIYSGKVSQ